MKRRVWEAGLLFLLALFLQTGGAALRTQAALSDKLIRLHVLAHSDAPADQSVKLQVRDRILAEAAPLLAGASARDDAEAILRDNLPRLADAARDTLSASGCTYPVTLELREDEFPTRYYGTFALPAGRYLALRVRIGDAAGKNWWCVAFPPLCGDAALGGPSDSGAFYGASDSGGGTLGGASAFYGASGDFTADEISLMTRDRPVYALKFRAVECWETLRQRLRPA